MLVSSIEKGQKTTIIRSTIGTPYVISMDQKTYASNPAICIGTTLCVQNCPTKAITMVKSKAVTDASKCISCGICETGNGKNFKGCPVKAVHQLK
jgi:ferredoxin